MSPSAANPASHLPTARAGSAPAEASRDQVSVRWLGQAGFLIGYQGLALLIDPYLSDYLAQKYAGTRFPHHRLMPAPLLPEQIDAVDVVCCTHRHSDHMDPATLPVLARRFPHCRFIVPQAEREHALALGIPAPQLVPMNAGQTRAADAAGRIHITALPAAHETLRINERGEHHCLGYILRFGHGLALYHSGDCVPWAGLEQLLAGQRLDLLLLPVNGRHPELSAHGILGNFTLAEAVALWRCVGARLMIVHHFGMFAFNTVAPETLRREIDEQGLAAQVLVPEPGAAFVLKAGD